jgi:hypothetical protein
LQRYFEQFGEVKRVKMNKVRPNGNTEPELREVEKDESTSHRGCGFVEMAYVSDQKAVLSFKDHYIDGFKIDCRLAMTNRERKQYHHTLNEQRRKIFAGKIPSHIKKEDIYKAFSRFARVEEVTIIFKNEKEFGICFILLKDAFAGDQFLNRQIEIVPGVVAECELALNPQQLHKRKLGQAATGSEAGRAGTPTEESEAGLWELKKMDSIKSSSTDDEHKDLGGKQSGQQMASKSNEEQSRTRRQTMEGKIATEQSMEGLTCERRAAKLRGGQVSTTEVLTSICRGLGQETLNGASGESLEKKARPNQNSLEAVNLKFCYHGIRNQAVGRSLAGQSSRIGLFSPFLY